MLGRCATCFLLVWQEGTVWLKTSELSVIKPQTNPKEFVMCSSKIDRLQQRQSGWMAIPLMGVRFEFRGAMQRRHSRRVPLMQPQHIEARRPTVHPFREPRESAQSLKGLRVKRNANRADQSHGLCSIAKMIVSRNSTARTCTALSICFLPPIFLCCLNVASAKTTTSIGWVQNTHFLKFA